MEVLRDFLHSESAFGADRVFLAGDFFDAAVAGDARAVPALAQSNGFFFDTLFAEDEIGYGEALADDTVEAFSLLPLVLVSLNEILDLVQLDLQTFHLLDLEFGLNSVKDVLELSIDHLDDLLLSWLRPLILLDLIRVSFDGLLLGLNFVFVGNLVSLLEVVGELLVEIDIFLVGRCFKGLLSKLFLKF